MGRIERPRKRFRKKLIFNKNFRSIGFSVPRDEWVAELASELGARGCVRSAARYAAALPEGVSLACNSMVSPT